MENKFKVQNKGTEFESLEISNRSSYLEISSKDRDGDVSIEYGNKYDSPLWLNQEELKTLIAFLQRQVK